MFQSRGLKRVRTTLCDYVENDAGDSTEQTDASTSIPTDWEKTTIHVVGETLGRDRDLLGVDYMFLVAPPSSAAAYAHLADRTGRNQRPGKTVTLIRPKEASKVVAIAGALGLSFASVEGTSTTSDAPSLSVVTSGRDASEGAFCCEERGARRIGCGRMV
jgi:superfamily II DNA/RNA helicase